jgi:hypothetical protein
VRGGASGVPCQASSPGWGADKGKKNLNSAPQQRGGPSRSHRQLYRQHRPRADIVFTPDRSSCRRRGRVLLDKVLSLSSAQNSGGIVACIELTLARTCAPQASTPRTPTTHLEAWYLYPAADSVCCRGVY